MKMVTGVLAGIVIGAVGRRRRPTRGQRRLHRRTRCRRREEGTGDAQRRRRDHRLLILREDAERCRSCSGSAPLKPGSGIGYHEQKEDEVYIVLSGKGVMTLDDKPTEVGPGTAILTRPGSSHGLKQVGNEDLVIIIAYEVK